MLYGVLFLASGAGVLAITYLLVSDTTKNGFYINAGHRSGIMPSAPGKTLSAPGTTDSVRSGQLSGAAAAAVRRAQLLPQLLQQHASDLHHMLIWSAIALAIMAVISIALGYYVAGRVLAPLRTITTTARAISARNLSERLALTDPKTSSRRSATPSMICSHGYKPRSTLNSTSSPTPPTSYARR